MFRRITWPSDTVQTLFSSGDSLDGAMDLQFAADVRYCQDLTRREAANFYWGFVALPRPQRVSIYALYSFARQVDDEADGGNAVGVTDQHVERFLRHRERLRCCFAAAAEDPVMRVLSEVVVRYGIPQRELEALVDGVEMDLRVQRYETWDDVQLYCRLVASTVGRMCVRIFGFRDPVALQYADQLGVAMQLTNILRDVREDVRLGRIYLPQDELRTYGVSEAVLAASEPVAQWEPFVRFQAARAHRLFDQGLRVTHLIPRRAAACVLTMAGIYQAILAEIERDPYLPLRCRASLSGKEKLAVTLRSWLRAA